MIKKYITKTTILIMVLLIWIGCYTYNQKSTGIPFNAPITVIKYNGTAVPTSLGDHNWIPKDGGSSYMTEGDYTVGQKTSKFTAKPGEVVKISIPSKPKNIRITQILDIKYKYKEYKITASEKDYIFTLPIEKGEYIFEVFANWDTDKHNTVTIFHVAIV